MSSFSTMCCKVICIFVVVVCFVSACYAAPFYTTDDTDGLTPQRLQLLKYIRDVLAMEERNKQEVLGKHFTPENEATGLMTVTPQKRFRPFRTQTRGGGVALCLWKVCPAAPWLVSKR